MIPRPDPLRLRFRIAEHRDRARLSQSRLALAIGCDHSYISRLESGERQPSRRIVADIARACDCSPVDTAELLALAGYAPDDPLALLAAEPAIASAARILPRLSTERAGALRNALAALLAAFDAEAA